MRRGLVIIGLVGICFIAESVLGDLLGRWFKPNLLIILIVFLNLSRGTHYSILAAFLAGLLKDSFSVKLFGLNIFSFVVCAYLTTFFKIYIYQTGSAASRVFMVFLISGLNVVIQYLMNVMLAPIYFGEAVLHVWLPEVLATTVAAGYVLEKLKQCVLRLSV